MQGRFDLKLLEAGHIPDHQWHEADRSGKLDQLLEGLSVDRECGGISNRIFDNMAAYFMTKLLSGDAIPAPFGDGVGDAQAALGYIAILSTASDPPLYTEASHENPVNIHNVTDSVEVSTAGKRFVEDQLTPFAVYTDPSVGRECVHFRNRWLYTPSQATSSVIRSVGIYYSEDADSTSPVNVGRIGRVRLKDNLGTPITLVKTGSQVLLLEYTFSLVSQ